MIEWIELEWELECVQMNGIEKVSGLSKKTIKCKVQVSFQESLPGRTRQQFSSQKYLLSRQKVKFSSQVELSGVTTTYFYKLVSWLVSITKTSDRN